MSDQSKWKHITTIRHNRLRQFYRLLTSNSTDRQHLENWPALLVGRPRNAIQLNNFPLILIFLSAEGEVK